MKRFALALFFIACAYGAKAKMYSPPAAASNPRLGWVAWPELDALMFCERRVDASFNQVGVAGPCWKLAAGATETKKTFSWLGLAGRDRSSPLAVPWDKCSLEYEIGRKLPQPAPARVWLNSPTEKKLLSEWLPTAEDKGDEFRLEASFSPEGKWLGIVHIAVSGGEDERAIDPDSAEIHAVPTCP